MGEITREDVIKLLRFENPDGHEHDFAIYADSFRSYQAAAENIAKNGDIVLHPRTGQPIENPYNAIREKAAASLRKIPLNVGCLWDSPRRWLVGGTGPGEPAPEEYAPVLARVAQEAAEVATADLTPPVFAWVKSAPDEAPAMLEIRE